MNNKIIVSVLFIGGTSVVKALTDGKPLTPILLGSYILLIILAIADMFGGRVSQIAGGISMIAVIYVLLNEFPWSTLSKALKGGKA